MIYFKRFLPQIQVVSSTHNDSNILANVLKKYGFYLIKGSSSRGAKNVLKEMISAYKKSNSIMSSNRFAQLWTDFRNSQQN